MKYRGVLWAACLVIPGVEASDALNEIRRKAGEQITKLPDYVCALTVDRAVRRRGDSSPGARDQLQLEVTVIGGKERFSRAGGQKFEDRELRDLIQRGVVSTGSFALHARHVFHPGAAGFKPAADVEEGGRGLLRFDYEVPWENSSYTLALPPHEATVAFRGHILAASDSFELARLELIADEIPRELGIDQTKTTISFGPMPAMAAGHLFPVRSEVMVSMLDGFEYHNRSELSSCREYKAESRISFAAETPEPAPRSTAATETLPSGLRMDLQLDEEIDLESVTPGQTFRAVLAEPLRSNEGALIAPRGTPVTGRVMRLELFDAPLNRYEAGLELTSITIGGTARELSARLASSHRGSGAIQQKKQFMPEFNKKRGNKFAVLARGSGRGQGTLHWDANQPRIRKGYRMTWTTGSNESESGDR